MSNENLIGQKIGKWLILREVQKNKHGIRCMECQCECGRVEIRQRYALISNNTHACKYCNTIDRIKRQTKHGAAINGSPTQEYSSWQHMKTRCYDTDFKQYYDYGGRGIIVCDRWLGQNGFINFLSDMGSIPIKGYTLERKCNDGNYEPSNCYWASKPIQSRNKRSNVYLEYKGERMVQRDWANKLGVHETSLLYQLKKGKTFEEIVEYYKNKKIAA
jgi:Pyruvate/2-oxoacid:ferredoxin oxidoreductase delta subunit